MNPEQIRYIFSSGLNKNQQIEALLGFGFKTREIQEILKCSPNTISKVKKSLDENGIIPEMGKVGRPTKKNDTVGKLIIKQTHADPCVSGSDLQNQIQSSFNYDISVTTINQFRKELGFNFLPPLSEPLLTPQHIEKRINFCYSILKRRNELLFIGFSDESKFMLGSDKRWLRRRRNERLPNATIKKMKYPPSAMVWGMIGYGYKSPLYILESTENSDVYQEIIIDNSYLIDAVTYYEGNFAFLCLKNRGKCIQHLITKGMNTTVTDEEIEDLFHELEDEKIILNEIEIILPKIE